MSASISPATVEDVFGEGDPAQPVREQSRISSLDFIRGLAVMGILAANIIAFGQPSSAYFTPDAFMVDPADPGGWQWIAQFVLIDGKMRGLFTLLFGAGMYLFMERAWARGSTRWLQMWRLVLLLGFGLIHFYLIWFGDILAAYGLIGFVALACMGWQAKTQMRLGLFGYILGGILYAGLLSFPWLVAETSFGEAEGMSQVRIEMLNSREEATAKDAQITALKQSGDYTGLIEKRFAEEWYFPFVNPLFFIVETLPLMLIGMALYRTGFFSGGYDPGKMRRWGWIGLIGGGAVSLGIALGVKQAGFGFFAGNAAFIGWSMVPRLAMILGFAALMVEYSPRWNGWLGQRISAAGRAAFTNYLGTSILMMFVFHGWALGLFGALNRPQLYLVTAIAWVVMLAWSKPWLDRYRYGPLEWLWRCLTYRQLFPLKREAP